jgi:hypothetical protein
MFICLAWPFYSMLRCCDLDGDSNDDPDACCCNDMEIILRSAHKLCRPKWNHSKFQQ